MREPHTLRVVQLFLWNDLDNLPASSATDFSAQTALASMVCPRSSYPAALQLVGGRVPSFWDGASRKPTFQNHVTDAVFDARIVLIIRKSGVFPGMLHAWHNALVCSALMLSNTCRDCGLACIMMVLQAAGPLAISLTTLQDLCKTTRWGMGTSAERDILCILC